MRLRILIASLCTLSLSSCLQTGNFFSGDAYVYGNGITGSPQFEAFRTVVRNNCIQCHAIFLSYTEAQWVSQGYVSSPGDPAQSAMYLKLRGASDTGNMPPTSTLAITDLAAVYDWILTVP